MRSRLLPMVGLGLLMSLFGCSSPKRGGAEGGMPPGGTLKVSPEVYGKMVSAFFTGALAYESSEKVSEVAELTTKFTEAATQLAPEEPAAWVNVALDRAVRRSNLPGALEAIEKARTLAPENAEVEAYYGLILSRSDKPADAAAHFNRALQLDPKLLPVRYKLAQDAELLAAPESQKTALEQYTKILEVEPNNLASLLGAMKLAASLNDANTLKSLLPRFAQRQAGFSDSIKSRLALLQKGESEGDVRPLAPELSGIGNLLKTNPFYQNDARRLRLEQRPLQHFIALPQPSRVPAPADTALTLTPTPLPSVPAGTFAVVESVTLRPELGPALADKFAQNPAGKPFARAEAPPALLYANALQLTLAAGDGKTQTLPFPSGTGRVKPTPEGIVFADFAYDFLPDLALAGAGGVKLYRQQESGTFQDVTAEAKLPSDLLQKVYVGAALLDVDLDGDLDLFLMPQTGTGTVLRNNGNGTWTARTDVFANVKNPRAFLWGDFNADGAADAALLDEAGRLTVYLNRRSGVYTKLEDANPGGKVLALASADADNDGRMDIVALREDGTILRLSRKPDESGWDRAELAKWNEVPKDGSARIAFAELDNNGAVDLIATGNMGSAVWLQEANGKFVPLAAPITARSLTVSSVSTGGRITPVGLDAGGKPIRLLNKGTKNYGFQEVRPRADYVTYGSGGDARINSFGLLGEMELRAGLLYQKQPITGSTLHFGLGTYPKADCIRILWPNGYPRTEFPEASNHQMAADTVMTAPYRLGGSCPWLFGWDGGAMKMITDCIWRSPLGLKINAFVTANVAQTEDWIKLRGDQLAPRDGFYDLRICAELWETHFFDYLALKTVDHPAGTEIWVDERFSIPPPPLRIITTERSQPILSARDDRGTSVTEIVAKRDGVYLDTFGRGPYQGITRDHWVEVTLPDRKAEPSDTLYLLASGWIHPTDTSINIALSQAGIKPEGLRLEVQTPAGTWRVAKPGLGFPTGKVKTVVLDLKGVFPAGQKTRRLRLRTNLEIYWDQIVWAKAAPGVPVKTLTAPLETAVLDYHGFSEANTKGISSPELADYNTVRAVRPQWLDLEGFYTRFGDVKPLLSRVDDRYVLMNAGDELRLRFKAGDPPPAGWVRDYVLMGDGWVKDGNFNTQYSKTVLPLPTHAKPDYTTPPTTLEADPVYQRHREDWKIYHTRFVSARDYLDALKRRDEGAGMRN